MVDVLLGSFLEKGELGVKTGKGFYSYPDPAFEQPAFIDAEDDILVPHYAMTVTLVGNAILLASNDIASPEEIDRAWTVGMMLDAGPFALLQEMGTGAFLQLLSSDANTFSPAETGIIEQYLAQSTEVSNGGN
jgi:3-hydroxybutyryl-CoA dehydrogenase